MVIFQFDKRPLANKFLNSSLETLICAYLPHCHLSITLLRVKSPLRAYLDPKTNLFVGIVVLIYKLIKKFYARFPLQLW